MAVITRWISHHPLLLLSVIVVLFVGFSSLHLSDPLVLDEIPFYLAFESVAQGNGPVFYYGETDPDYFFDWHPPSYVYTLGILASTTGLSVELVRGFSLVLSTLTLLLIYFLSIHVFKKHSHKERIGLLAALLFAISPFVIQSSTLIDIDGSLLLFAMTLVTYVICRLNFSSWQHPLFVGVLFGLLLWIKFQSVIILLPSIGLYLLLLVGLRKAIGYTALIGVTTIVLFSATWSLYASSQGIDPFQPLTNTLNMGFSEDEKTSVSIIKKGFIVFWAIKNIVLWTTPALLILVLFGMLSRVWDYVRTLKATPLDFVIISSVITFTLLILFKEQAYGFPKYFITMMPGFCVLAAYNLVHFAPKNYPSWMSLGVAVLTIAGLHLVIGDPLIDHNFFYQTNASVQDNPLQFLTITGIQIIWYVGVLVLVYILFRLFSTPSAWWSTLLVVLMVLSIALNLFQLHAPYSTQYYYGQTGMLEAAAYIQDHTQQGDLIVAREDIAYYSNRDYYRPQPHMESRISQPVSYAVLSPKDSIRDYTQDSFTLHNQEFTFVGEAGHFRVFKAIP